MVRKSSEDSDNAEFREIRREDRRPTHQDVRRNRESRRRDALFDHQMAAEESPGEKSRLSEGHQPIRAERGQAPHRSSAGQAG